MRSFLITFATAVSVVTALGGCSSKTSDCQSAFNRDPLSARKRDPLAEMLGG